MPSAFEINQKREDLKKAYPRSSEWSKKVNLMRPDQVVAIHLRLKRQKKI